MLISGLTRLPRNQIRAIILASDTVLAYAALAVAGALLSLSGTPNPWGDMPPATLAVYGVGVPAILMFLRLPLTKLSVLNARDILHIVHASAILFALCWAILAHAQAPFALTMAALAAVVFFAGAVLSRIAALVTLEYLRERGVRRAPVAVFGAGGKGIQAATALLQSPNERLDVFFDDNPTLHGMAIGGVSVLSPRNMISDLRKRGIERVIIALPKSGTERQKSLVKTCEAAGIEVRILPSYIDMLVDKAGMRDLKAVRPHDLLGRDKVDLETPEIAKTYAGRVILVTGAGGSIGSELCRQLLHCRPAKIVLLDHSEFLLYEIERKLRDLLGEEQRLEISSRIGSVTDPVLMAALLKTEKIEIVLHAAAYKHVPIVEANDIEGARNNIIGTKVIAEAAAAANVERFILISTDKAVRPSSIMGATKRLAELVVQDIQTRAPNTVFSMVRFGNVLGSSGSVLPLFQAQIDAGGPVTVTHPRVTRYFMTVAEASRLVLLAGCFATGGDVFLLDMGKPQRILSIAQRMIRLSGRTVKNQRTGEGDIAIEIVGLRPGEKLHEELLIDAASTRKTPHDKILWAEESKLSQFEMAAALKEIGAAIENTNSAALRKALEKRVDGLAKSASKATQA